MSIPRDPSFDNSLAFFREGYDFVANHCRALGSDAFRTRIMMRPVVCMMGAEAAERFYDGRHFTRAAAMPPTTVRQLQDKGSVQTLDGEAHRHRKALFMTMLTGDAVERIGRLFDECWQAAVPPSKRQGQIVLHEEVCRLLCQAVCAWAGAPVEGKALDARTREMMAMIDGAGSVGPRALRGLARRRRSEAWARRVIAAARRAPPQGEPTPVQRIATYTGPDGQLLDLRTAGVELLNLIRPNVAVGRFITFAALALHEHPDAAAWLRENVEGRLRAFAQEVRRFYPFFPVIAGTVKTPFEWHEHAFRAGDWVMLGLHATNHDARLWDAPQTFRPQRFLHAADMPAQLIPQGGGAHARDHRCPGEWITVELLGRAVRQLLAMRYAMPPQDLAVPLTRFPTLPKSGFVIVPE
jgi:fatty-acid peroxygenase